MKVKNLNASSRKTRALIKETFAQMMLEKQELHNITVTELVKRAAITRSTFYTHYENIYDVVKDIQDETLDVLVNDNINLTNLNDIHNYLNNIFAYLKENEHIYSMILKSNEALFYMERLNGIINKKLKESLTSNDSDMTLNISFFVDGCINLIIKYYRNQIDVSLDDINIFIQEILQKLFFIN